MFGSDILEIVTGMVFVFLLLSLVCSAVNEFIEALVKNRAKDLEQGIGELLGDPKNSTKFINQIYNHGLVNALFKGTYPPTSKGDLPSYIPAQNFVLAVMDLVKNPPTGRIPLPPNLDTALRTFKASAAGDAAKFQAGLEDWYNSGMDRVSGWYKRRAQWILLVLGLVVAIAVNADTGSIAKGLANNASLRKGIVATAQARASAPLPPTANAPNAAQIREQLKDLKDLALPIGWEGETSGAGLTGSDWAWAVFKAHAFGWLLTAIAISLGAPFWFDLLNKFMAVRSSVKPEEDKPQQGKRDHNSTTIAG